MSLELTPELILNAYVAGCFPMADPQTGEIHWYAPDPRAILPLDDFRVSRSLRRTVRSGVFEIRMDTSFTAVVRACAERQETWISDTILSAYTAIHRLGYAHSVEAWCDDELAGGLYGVSVGGAFFGESMFHRKTNASKVALVYLVEHLRSRGFQLLDTQFATTHLERFGVKEISREDYEIILRHATRLDVTW